MRDLGGARIAAVGPATANKLKELHLQVDLMPDEALGSEIAKAFAKFETIENLKICLLRAEVANRELPEALEALGAIVDDVACYQTVPETEDPTGRRRQPRWSGARIGWRSPAGQPSRISTPASICPRCSRSSRSSRRPRSAPRPPKPWPRWD